MKILSTVVLTVGLCASCATNPYNYSHYVGEQKNWTTSSGSYVRTVNDVPIYSQYPSQPYEVVGAVVVDSERALARAVKHYHADAAMIYNRNSGVGGSVTTVTGPLWASYPIYETRITAQLIRFKR